MSRIGVTFVDPDGRLRPIANALRSASIPVAETVSDFDSVDTTPDCLVILDAPETADQPEVNGLSFLERALERFDCPVVVYTLREGYEAVKSPLEAGATDVIRVPAHRPALIARRVEYAAGYGGEFESRSAQLSSLLRNYPHTLFIKDDVGRFANVTTHTAGNYGFTREELIGMSDYELFDPDHADDLWEAEQRIIDEDQPMINDIEEYVDQGGNRRWVSTTKVPRYDPDGEIVGIVGGTQDVTPAKQQETLMAALHEASRQLSRATTKADIAAVTVEIAREIDYLPAVAVALEASGELAPIESSETDGDQSIFDRYQTAFRRAHERGETHYVDTDGSITREASMIVNAVFEGPYESGEVAITIPLGGHGVLGLAAPSGAVDDFSDRLAHVLASNVAAAFDRAERERELARKNRQLEEFATLGAHELRNRLQIALANVAHERAKRDSSRLEGTEHTLERMERLLTQLLQLAQTSRIPRTTDATGLREAAERAWGRIETERTTLSLPPEMTLAANGNALVELFDFLFTNAVEHGHGGSGPGPDDPDEAVNVEVGLLEDGFYVADDGVGIPDDQKSDLFEIEYADAADESGYGLYIASAIVEAHGWEIDVLDSDAGGARFEITGVEWH